MRKTGVRVAGAIVALAGLGGYLFLRAGPGTKTTKSSSSSPAPSYVEPSSTWNATGPYYDIFRFNVAWSDLPEGIPETRTVSNVKIADNKGVAFFQLVDNQATFTKEKYGFAINTAGTESPCDASIEPCYRIRISARFTLHHLYEKDSYGSRQLVGAPRWCGVLASRSSVGEYLSNGLVGHTECPNVAEPNYLSWEWMTWHNGPDSVPVWSADYVTYGRPLSQMNKQVAIEVRAAAEFPCWTFGEREWNLAYEHPSPPGAEFPKKGYTKHDLLIQIESWSDIVARLSGASGEAAKLALEEQYPDVYKNLAASKELVNGLRDLVEATSPEATEAKKAELLAKYEWLAIKKVLTALGAPKIALTAIEVGYAMGAPIGTKVATTCEAVQVNQFRTWALLGYHQNKASADAGHEFAYEGRVFRRRKDGTFEVRIAGDPVGAMAAFPVIGIFADRQSVWLPLPGP